MGRESRVNQQLKASKVRFSTRMPATNDMYEGEERDVYLNNVLYIYKKRRGRLWRFTGEQVQ